MADNPKTPPTGTPALNPPPPPRALPTLATVQAAVEASLREIRGARIDIDWLKSEQKLMKAKLVEAEEVIRVSYLPRPSSLTPAPSAPATPVPQSRPSMAAKAAHGTSKYGQRALAVLGALGAIGQVVSYWKPQYTGPITQALDLLRALVGGGQ